MFDELWDDTSIRIRNAGIAEISVNKRLSEVQGIPSGLAWNSITMTLPSEDEKLEDMEGVIGALHSCGTMTSCQIMFLKWHLMAKKSTILYLKFPLRQLWKAS